MHLAPKLDQLEKRFDELTQQMADPAVISDSDQYRKVTKAQSELSLIVAKYREWKKVEDSLSQARPMLREADPDLKAMAELEITELEPQKVQIEEDLKVLLLGGGDKRRRFGDQRGGGADGVCSGGDCNPTFKPNDHAGPKRRLLRHIGRHGALQLSMEFQWRGLVRRQQCVAGAHQC